MSEQTGVQARIEADLRTAMRNRDEVAKLALRGAKTALAQASRAGSEQVSLDDEAVMAVLRREVKSRRDAAEEFEKVGSRERAEQERAELAVLERYLPQQMEEGELEALARSVIAEVGATSPREMGKVMAAIMPRTAGRADGKRVNQVVRRLLGG